MDFCQVQIHQWKDVKATYLGKKDDTYGLWYFIIDGGEDPLNHYNKIGKDFKFAISYTVNGKTYWDNNFNENYTMNLGDSLGFPGLK